MVLSSGGIAQSSQSTTITKHIPLSAPCVTVIPAWLIVASSEAVGTWWSFGLAALTQLEATSQSPPAELSQIMLARRVRSSRSTA